MAYQSEIEKLEQRYRENPQQWFAALADSYRKAGSLDLALDVVKAGLEKRPNYVSGHIVHGRCLIDQQKDDEAQAVFERVLSLDAENVIAIKALAEIGGRTGNTETARRWVGRLLEVDPMNEEAQEMMARLASASPPAAAPEPPVAAAPETDLSAAGALLAGFDEQAASLPPPVADATPAPEPEVAAPAAQSDDALMVERAVEAEFGEEIAEQPTVEMAPAVQDQPPQAAALEGLEPTEFPSAVEEAAPPPDLAPFDDSLAWGTGERTSRQITAADVERAEHAHEASLDQTVHALPGLESADVPPVDAEPASVASAAGEAPGAETPDVVPPAAAFADADGGALPLIYPDEPEAPQPSLAASEPEPVVTETMAELYAAQGLHDEARETYRKLLEQRPGDPGLAGRLAALGPGGGGRTSGAAPAVVRRTVAAAATGGASVRQFLSDVFDGRPSGKVMAPAPPMLEPVAPAVAPPAPSAPPPPAAPPEPTVMEAAFEESGGAPVSGEPTRRASDEVSLAAVFGEEPPPPKSADSAAARPSAAKPFSFDEFFGAPRASRETAAGTADDDDFKRWLKSLKS